MVCTELKDLTDIKLIAIAREKVERIIAGEADISHQSKYDQTVTVHLPQTTFRSRTEVNLLVYLHYNSNHYEIDLTEVGNEIDQTHGQNEILDLINGFF